MDKQSISNAVALLDECHENGMDGSDALCSWFAGEQDVIKQTLADLSEMLPYSKVNPKK